MHVRLSVCCMAFVATTWLGHCAAAAAEPQATSPAPVQGADLVNSSVQVQAWATAKLQEYPWGWIRWLINGEIDSQAEMTFGVVYIKPHQVNSLHLHPNSAEYLHVTQGSCEHRVGNTWVKLKVGDTIRIAPHVPHMARTQDESCQAVIVYNTGSRQFVEVQEGK